MSYIIKLIYNTRLNPKVIGWLEDFARANKGMEWFCEELDRRDKFVEKYKT